MKVIVDAEEEVEREENFSLESKVRRTESLIPDSLGVVRLEWKISPLSTFTPARSFVSIPRRTVAFALFPLSRRGEERRSFGKPLPIKFDGRAGCSEWFTQDLFRGWIERLIHRHLHPRFPRRDVNTATYRDAFTKGNLVSHKHG